VIHFDPFQIARSSSQQYGLIMILPRISTLTSFFGVTRDPKYTNSLATSKILSPKADEFGNAKRPRWRRVTNGRIILFRRLCMQR
jgi:hypothetical protein